MSCCLGEKANGEIFRGGLYMKLDSDGGSFVDAWLRDVGGTLFEKRLSFICELEAVQSLNDQVGKIHKVAIFKTKNPVVVLHLDELLT